MAATTHSSIGRYAQYFADCTRTAARPPKHSGVWLCASTLCNLSLCSDAAGLVATVYVKGKPHVWVHLHAATARAVMLDPQTTGDAWVLWVDAPGCVGDSSKRSSCVEVAHRVRFAFQFEQDAMARQCQDVIQVRLQVKCMSFLCTLSSLQHSHDLSPRAGNPPVEAAPTTSAPVVASEHSMGVVTASAAGTHATCTAGAAAARAWHQSSNSYGAAQLPPNLQRAVEVRKPFFLSNQ